MLLFSLSTEPNRFLRLTKKVAKFTVGRDRESFPLQICENSIRHIDALLEQYPLTADENGEKLLPTRRIAHSGHASIPFSVQNGVTRKIVVPSMANVSDEFRMFRSNLPIYPYRQLIIDTIDTNQVVVISGETGE